jgi:hypothetical protein
MTNPICAAMGWPVPGPDEQLHISLNGKLVARLTAARGGYAEGLYLSNPAGANYGSCFSAGPGPREPDVIRYLADKLRIRPATLSQLTVNIIAPEKLRRQK